MSSYMENFCVGPCPQGCMGPACRNYGETRVFVCDACGAETTTPEGWYINHDDARCDKCTKAEEDDQK